MVGRNKPKLGQNFLSDQRAAEKIVDALGNVALGDVALGTVAPGDPTLGNAAHSDISQSLVVEIGPGKGALTDILVQRAGRLIAIELDHMLAAELRYRYARNPTVEILEGDVLRIDFRTVLNRTIGPLNDLRPDKPARARVVGNLPYYITSDILLRLFEFHDQFEIIVIMVQREVADRIAANHGSRDYGLLSATAQLYTRVEKLFTLPPGAFSPPPKVHSGVLRLTVAPRFAELQVDQKPFIQFLKTAFAMKRKTLLNNLKKAYPDDQVRAAIKGAGLRADVRAEAIPLEASAAVFRGLTTG